MLRQADRRVGKQREARHAKPVELILLDPSALTSAASARPRNQCASRVE